MWLTGQRGQEAVVSFCTGQACIEHSKLVVRVLCHHNLSEQISMLHSFVQLPNAMRPNRM